MRLAGGHPVLPVMALAGLLQRTVSEAGEAIDATAECRVDSQPLLSRYKDVWLLSPGAVSVVENAASRHERRARGILPYRRPEELLTVVRTWLEVHERITCGDQARLAAITQAGALNQLERGLVTDGYLVRGKGKAETPTSSPAPAYRGQRP